MSDNGRQLIIAGASADIVNNVKKLAKKASGNVDIGIIFAIAYNTIRDGKHEKYVHEFIPASRPFLRIRNNGLIISGGNYIFLDSGINDR